MRSDTALPNLAGQSAEDPHCATGNSVEAWRATSPFPELSSPSFLITPEIRHDNRTQHRADMARECSSVDRSTAEAGPPASTVAWATQPVASPSRLRYGSAWAAVDLLTFGALGDGQDGQ